MKKVLFFAAAAVAMLTGCSQSDDLTAPTVAQNAQQQEAIEFGTYMGRQAQTRAGSAGPIIATSTSPFKTAEYVMNEKGGFGVFAWHKTGADSYTYSGTTAYAPDFMYNQKVEMNTDNGKDGSTAENAKGVSTWKYSPIKYWPNEYQDGDDGDGDETEQDIEGGVEEAVGLYGRKLFDITVVHGEDDAQHGAYARDDQSRPGDEFSCGFFHNGCSFLGLVLYIYLPKEWTIICGTSRGYP